MSFAKEMFTLLCDDFRQEIGNKHTIVGVYGSELYIPNVPDLLPKLCFAVLCREVKRIPLKVTVRINLPKLGEKDFELGFPSGVQIGGDVQMVVMISPFRIEEEGVATFKVYVDDAKRPSLTHTLKLFRHKEKE